MVERLTGRNPMSATALAGETGVAQSTLLKMAEGCRYDLSAEEKVTFVLEAAAVPEAEVGAFLRRKGVREAQLAEWRQQVTQGAVAALRGPSKRDRKAASIEARRVRDLERELQRKEKALAEAAALLVLKTQPRRSGGTRTTTRTRGTTNDS